MATRRVHGIPLATRQFSQVRGFRTELHGLPHGLASHPAGCPIYLPSRCGRQAVQAETLHTATVEGIDFANLDAAVSTQCCHLPANWAARRMRCRDCRRLRIPEEI